MKASCKQPLQPKPHERAQTAAASAKLWHPEQGLRPGDSREEGREGRKEGGDPTGENTAEPIPGKAATPEAEAKQPRKGYP